MHSTLVYKEECVLHTNLALGWFGCCCCRRELLYLKLGTLAVEVVLAIKAYMEEFQWSLKAICDSADDKGFLRHTLNDC